MMQYIKDFTYYMYSVFFVDSYELSKKKLENSEVSKSRLYEFGLYWYSMSAFLKKVTWGSSFVLPLIIGGMFSSPLIAICLFIPCVVFITFLTYEEKLIRNALKIVDMSETMGRKLEVREENEKRIIKSLDECSELEKNHDLSHLESWDIEKGGELLKKAVLEVKKGTKTETLMRVSELVNSQLNKVVQSILEKKGKMVSFIKKVTEIKKKYSENRLVLSKKSLVESSQSLIGLQKGHNLEHINIGSETFNWVFHVRSISDLESFCRTNLTQLLLLFQKIEGKGLKIVCKVDKGAAQNNSKKTKQLDTPLKDNLSEEGLSNDVTKSDFCDVLSQTNPSGYNKDVSDIVSSSHTNGNGWKLNFKLVPKKDKASLVDEQPIQRQLEARIINQSSENSDMVFLLSIKDSPENPLINNTSEIDLEKLDEKSNETDSLTKMLSIFSSVLDEENQKNKLNTSKKEPIIRTGNNSGSKYDDQIPELLTQFSSILNDERVVESTEERSIRLEREESEFQAMMAALNY